MIRARFAAAGALAGLLLLGAAPPQKAGRFETEYLITGEVQGDGWTERTFAENDVVFQQRLSFAALATADVALALDGGQVVVPAGEQYFRAASDDAEVWCTANMRMPTDDFAKTIVGRVYPQYCIYDADKDGAFDLFFKKQRTIEALPNIKGKVPGNLRRVAPIRLTPIPSSRLRTAYYIGVLYMRTTKKEPRVPQFQMYAGSEHGMFYISGWVVGTPGEKQQIRIADAVIEVSTTAQGTSGKLVKPFGTGATRIRGTNCGWINGC